MTSLDTIAVTPLVPSTSSAEVVETAGDSQCVDSPEKKFYELPYRLLVPSHMKIGQKMLCYGYDAVTLRPVFTLSFQKMSLEMNTEEFTRLLKSPMLKGLLTNYEGESRRFEALGSKVFRRLYIDNVNFISIEVKRSGHRIILDADDAKTISAIQDALEYDADNLFKNRARVKAFVLKLREKLDTLYMKIDEFDTPGRELFWHDLVYPDSSMFGIDYVRLRHQYVAFYQVLKKQNNK